MNATIVSFRRGRTTQTPNQMILQPKGCQSKDEAQKFVGKTVTFTTQTGKKIVGKITGAHGNSGAVRALFEKGMPGQAVTQNVLVE
ncbi:MAG: 50S ribosomal protein L35ae [Candidatus Woesearchaeota archaeon]